MAGGPTHCPSAHSLRPSAGRWCPGCGAGRGRGGGGGGPSRQRPSVAGGTAQPPDGEGGGARCRVRCIISDRCLPAARTRGQLWFSPPPRPRKAPGACEGKRRANGRRGGEQRHAKDFRGTKKHNGSTGGETTSAMLYDNDWLRHESSHASWRGANEGNPHVRIAWTMPAPCHARPSPRHAWPARHSDEGRLGGSPSPRLHKPDMSRVSLPPPSAPPPLRGHTRRSAGAAWSSSPAASPFRPPSACASPRSAPPASSAAAAGPVRGPWESVPNASHTQPMTMRPKGTRGPADLRCLDGDDRPCRLAGWLGRLTD